MCPNAGPLSAQTTGCVRTANARLAARAEPRRQSSDLIAGFIPHAGFTTFVILVINLGLYAATVIASMKLGSENPLMDIDGRALVEFGAKFPPAIAAGQWWRLVTAGFLHGNLFHIFMNSWALFSVGAQVEETYGTARFLALYFVANVVGFFASTYFSPSLSVGASAALFGLIGAMIAAGMRTNTAMGAAIEPNIHSG